MRTACLTVSLQSHVSGEGWVPTPPRTCLLPPMGVSTQPRKAPDSRDTPPPGKDMEPEIPTPSEQTNKCENISFS